MQNNDNVTSATPDLERLFIYGSLAPNCPNHHIVAHIDGQWQSGTVEGHLVQQGWGAVMGFPGIVISDLTEAKEEVKGMMLSLLNLPKTGPCWMSLKVSNMSGSLFLLSLMPVTLKTPIFIKSNQRNKKDHYVNGRTTLLGLERSKLLYTHSCFSVIQFHYTWLRYHIAYRAMDCSQRSKRRHQSARQGDSELVNKLAHLLCYLFCLDADYHRSARLHRSWINEHRLCYRGSSQSEQRGVVGVPAKL